VLLRNRLLRRCSDEEKDVRSTQTVERIMQKYTQKPSAVRPNPWLTCLISRHRLFRNCRVRTASSHAELLSRNFFHLLFLLIDRSGF
jgi:hypothetical protein